MFKVISEPGLCSPFIHSVVSNGSGSGPWRPWSDSGQSLRCSHEESLDPWILSYPLSAKRRLIRLGGCPDWSESSLRAHAILLFCYFAMRWLNYGIMLLRFVILFLISPSFSTKWCILWVWRILRNFINMFKPNHWKERGLLLRCPISHLKMGFVVHAGSEDYYQLIHYHNLIKNITLVLLKICPAFANSVAPDKLASGEAYWSGSALFSINM